MIFGFSDLQLFNLLMGETLVDEFHEKGDKTLNKLLIWLDCKSHNLYLLIRFWKSVWTVFDLFENENVAWMKVFNIKFLNFTLETTLEYTKNYIGKKKFDKSKNTPKYTRIWNTLKNTSQYTKIHLKVHHSTPKNILQLCFVRDLKFKLDKLSRHQPHNNSRLSNNFQKQLSPHFHSSLTKTYLSSPNSQKTTNWKEIGKLKWRKLKTRISVSNKTFSSLYRRQHLRRRPSHFSVPPSSGCHVVVCVIPSRKTFQLKSISNCLAATKIQTTEQIFV